MNKKVIIILVIVLAVVAILFIQKGKKNESVIDTNTVKPTTGIPANGIVKEFTVTGGNFKFDPSEIRVNAGDTVKITFTNAEGFHDLVINEFSAKTAQIKSGESETIEFVADKVGTFEYYCSVGSHRAQGMVGKLIVE